MGRRKGSPAEAEFLTLIGEKMGEGRRLPGSCARQEEVCVETRHPFLCADRKHVMGRSGPCVE